MNVRRCIQNAEMSIPESLQTNALNLVHIFPESIMLNVNHPRKVKFYHVRSRTKPEGVARFLILGDILITKLYPFHIEVQVFVMACTMIEADSSFQIALDEKFGHMFSYNVSPFEAYQEPALVTDIYKLSLEK